MERIVGALSATGELDNTVFVFTSDNGFLGGHDRIERGKVRHYEESSRAQLIVRGPGFPAGARVAGPVANIDLAPTIAEAARAAPRRVADGVALAPLARSPSAASGRNILIEHPAPIENIPNYMAVRSARHKYVVHASGERELYDLRRDPHELDSRHADPAFEGTRRWLAARLTELRRCVGVSCRQGPIGRREPSAGRPGEAYSGASMGVGVTAGEKRAMRCVVASLAALAATLLAPVTQAAATPIVHAHRGGSVLDGAPRYPENTLPAFRNAALREKAVLELDVNLTRDRVPVVIHDDALGRTTTCRGPVKSFTAREIARCKADVLGSPGNGVPTRRVARPTESPPRLADVLALARRTGARVNVEIKNFPGENDFDSTPAYAERIVDEIERARMPSDQVIVQSFFPLNLDVSERRLPRVDTSLLSLRETNDNLLDVAKARGYEYVSPGWPVSSAYIARAHALGRRIVPYTLNRPAEVRAAARRGVDEIITDDPRMARRALAQVEPRAPAMPPPPSARACARVRAERSLPTAEAYADEPGAPRVFAMQFKQEIRHVTSYAAFRTKVECTIRERVLPRLARGRPNVVALNEDIGLMTIATGSRGRAARATFGNPGGAPGCEGQPAPCGALGALLAVRAGYSRETTAYAPRFPGLDPLSGTFVATTDTFARGWMQTFSDMARRYDVYILGSNNQAPFRESRDPSEIAAFADPDRPPPDSVYVATDPQVYNEVFMWGPDEVRRDGPRPLRNVVARNRKVPLTPIEEQLQLTNGPSRGPDGVANVAPYRLPGTAARISFATSLPAFVYGDPPRGVDPCSNTRRYYMRCVDKLGANVVMQDEANPGRWAGTGGQGAWQPLEWMTSTWRAVADPTVDFDYNVTPHLVGNLADIPFDGQTAITQRGGTEGAGCHYVGNRRWLAGEDPPRFRDEAGPKDEFLALVPWVVPDGPRDRLRRIGDRLAAGSGSALENDYLETAVAADLTFPVDTSREGCVASGGGSDAPGLGPGGGAPAPGDCAGRAPTVRGTSAPDVLEGTERADVILAGAGNDRVDALGGDDLVCGGSDDDVLSGDGGDDRLAGESGDDRLTGGPGRDALEGGSGSDRCEDGTGAGAQTSGCEGS